MLARTPISPRKKPRQARSVATVGVLLDATARVLARDGYDRASTNRIASWWRSMRAPTSDSLLRKYWYSEPTLTPAASAMRLVLARS